MRAYEQLVLEASQFSREERLDGMFLPPGPRLGDVVVEAQRVTKAFADRLLMDQVSFNLPPGGRCGGERGEGRGSMKGRPGWCMTAWHWAAAL